MLRNEPVLNKWGVFCLVAVGIFMSTLDGSIVNIALPTIMQEFLAPLSTIEWVMLIYLLTVSSLLLSFGRLSDIKGRRWVYSRGLFVFSVGSMFCGLATSAVGLILARSFQGVGAAMIMACTPALIIDAFPASERGKALGMVGTVVASGLTLGPALGGLIIHTFSWQTIFWINIPIGLAAALITAKVLKGTQADLTQSEPFDIPGALFFTLALSSFIVILTHGYDWGFASLPVLSAVCVSLLAMIALIRLETRIPYPIFQPSLLKIRMFTFPILSAILLFSSLFTMIFLMPFYLMHPCGFPVNRAGYIMVTPFIFLFAFSPISGAISDRIGSRFLCTTGMGILVMSLYMLSRLDPTSDSLSIAWRMALPGIGTAIFIAPNSSAIMSAVPRQYMGVAAGTVATARNLGMVIGIALAGMIFNVVFNRLSGGMIFKTYHIEMEAIFMNAFEYAMLSGCFMAGLGMVTAYLRGADYRKKRD